MTKAKTLPLLVRRARAADVAEIAEILGAKRKSYEAWQPVFWKRAKHQHLLTLIYIHLQVYFPRGAFLVCERQGEVAGFLLASTIKAPPVFDPGGRSILVDDFCVRDPDDWPTIGTALFDELQAIASAKSWRQVIAVCAEQDRPKAVFLKGVGLSTASIWCVGTFGQRAR
ncbi:MAG: N-acetyltransferase family protein [Novosphingobium sp.]